jgi:hypothetical protein
VSGIRCQGEIRSTTWIFKEGSCCLGVEAKCCEFPPKCLLHSPDTRHLKPDAWHLFSSHSNGLNPVAFRDLPDDFHPDRHAPENGVLTVERGLRVQGDVKLAGRAVGT